MTAAASTVAIERPPPVARPWTSARKIGVALLVFWALAGLGLAWYLASRWSPDFFATYFPRYMRGLWITIQLVVISIVFGALLSAPVAWARMSKNRVANTLAGGFVYFFRSTPLLAQLYLINYGLGSFRGFWEPLGLWWFFREPWWCAILSFTLNTAAYQAEILRGAIQSLPKGQWEGAAALAMPKWLTLRKIIAPQALIVALRPYGNEIILMIKGSAIVALVTIYDLMGETRRAYSQTFDFQAYIWAAIIYLAIVETLRRILDAVEARITRHLIR